MLEFILKLLFPDYYEYQDEMKKQILKLEERECVKNEK